jgi:antitoxin component YwqK of YwqJK toxin-antitoxin module
MQRIIIAIAIAFSFHSSLSAQTLNQIDGNGQKQGRWVKTYQNGYTRYEGQFRNDKPNGEFHYYYESGKLQAVSKFSDDGVICNSSSFFENGNPMSAGTFVNQKKDGKWTFYSDIDGKKVAEENYSEDVLDGRKVTLFPETGEPAEIIYYKKGMREGVFQRYFLSGKVMIAGKYANDLLDGEYTVYYENGKIEIHGFYSKAQQIGNWEYFDENGNPLNESDYRKQEDPEEKIHE